MTSQKDIQSLIADIDGILPKAGSRLPWSKPGDIAQERRVLERVRSYLVSLQQNVAIPEHRPVNPALPEGVREIVEAVTQEMDFLRADLLHPLLEDMEALRQEREALIHEVQQLQRTRQRLDAPTARHPAQPSTTADFSQELISRCTESLTQQVTQLFANLEARLASPGTAIATNATNPSASNLGGISHSQDRVEQLRQVQDQSDQMLLALDVNQRAIFETLQRNLYGYQESMAQGLEKMHSLSVQGELLFTALVNRLAEQLGRETSTLWQSSRPHSGSAIEFQEATTSATTPETLLPSSGSGITDLRSQLPSLPLQPPETLSSTPESARSSFSNSEVLLNLTSVSPTPYSATPPTQEDRLLENLNDNWEIIEELELDSPINEPDETDGLETFIQLDIEPPSLPRTDELEHGDENLSSSATVGAGETNELTSGLASQGREIDDLYATLFGTADSSASSLRPTGADVFVENVLFEGLTDPAIEAPESPSPNWSERDSSDSWEVLFFEDSPTQPPIESELAEDQSSLPLTSSSNHTNERSSVKTITALTDLFEEMELSHQLPTVESNLIPEQASESLTPDTEPSTVEVEEDYIPASPEEDLLAMDALESELDPELWFNQNALQQLQQDLSQFEGSEGQELQNQNNQRSLFDYSQTPPFIAPEIPSSNQTNYRFLVSEELLAEDWEEYVFHELSDEDAAAHEAAGSSQLDTGEENRDISTNEARIAQNSPLAPPESIASDFDPDLFPSETLELDHENTVSSSSETPEAPGIHRELNTLEDEPFVEMLWDEPVDSTTEEMISSPELEFEANVLPQVPLDSQEDTVSAAKPQSSTEEQSINPRDLGLNTVDNEILSEARGNDAPSTTQETSFSSPTAAKSWDSLSEEQVDVEQGKAQVPDEAISVDSSQEFALPPEPVENSIEPMLSDSLEAEQQDEGEAQFSASKDSVEVSEEVVMPGELVVTDNEALAEVELSDRLAQEAQTSSETDFDTTSPQPEKNLEQPGNQKEE